MKPIIGIICNLATDTAFTRHVASDKYARSVIDVSDCMPILLPVLGDAMCADSLLGNMDGLVLTGGASNIEPHHYGQEPAPGEDIRDPGRDAMALTMVPRAVELGVPLFGICRGFQEINVALGGTLHQRLHEIPGKFDHRRPRDQSWEVQLSARQRIALTENGLLSELLDGALEIMVNTLHGQGVDQVAEALEVEATADDGTVEAFKVRDAETFAVGVQWHAEHKTADHVLYRSLFESFGDAARNRMRSRLGHKSPVVTAAA
jgi:putative glutamine amidotransferase